MARLKVVWSETAIKERNHIFEYWNDRNKSTAYSKKLKNKINRRIGLLKHFPEMGINTDFKDTKALSMVNYSIFYKIMDFQIIITAFWDNRQDPSKLARLLKEK